MHLQYLKNIQFTRLIKTGTRLREFNFRKINGLDTNQYSVDVVDERGDRIMFNMLKKNEQWEVTTENLPFWVAAVQDKLEQAIEEVV
jgi:hypothetical protein